MKELDRGAFGQVVRCFDHKTKREVAVKINKCINVQHNNTCRAEAAIMQRLRDTECDDSLNAYKGHIVHYIDNFLFRNHYCFVVELLGKNLYAELKENGYQGFDLKSKLRNVIFQIV
jgi:dual specificity tyrosine-phosphorylation-regulated kinase 2/3/4